VSGFIANLSGQAVNSAAGEMAGKILSSGWKSGNF
jgi:hypothetical protein